MLGIGLAIAWVQRRTNPTRQMVLSPTPTTTPTANLPTGTGGAVPGVSTRSLTPPPITQAGSALVIDPPSNVRESPNGQIICAVREKININLYERQGLWYRTDVCGRMGWIHASQLKF
jgi:hypothetical protein